MLSHHHLPGRFDSRLFLFFSWFFFIHQPWPSVAPPPLSLILFDKCCRLIKRQKKVSVRRSNWSLSKRRKDARRCNFEGRLVQMLSFDEAPRVSNGSSQAIDWLWKVGTDDYFDFHDGFVLFHPNDGSIVWRMKRIFFPCSRRPGTRVGRWDPHWFTFSLVFFFDEMKQFQYRSWAWTWTRPWVQPPRSDRRLSSRLPESWIWAKSRDAWSTASSTSMELRWVRFPLSGPSIRWLRPRGRYGKAPTLKSRRHLWNGAVSRSAGADRSSSEIRGPRHRYFSLNYGPPSLESANSSPTWSHQPESGGSFSSTVAIERTPWAFFSNSFFPPESIAVHLASFCGSLAFTRKAQN